MTDEIPGSLRAVRKAMRAEERAAARWLARHWDEVQEPRPDDRVVMFGSADDLDAWAEATGRGTGVLAARSGVSLFQLDAQQRVTYCLSKMKPEHQELLRARYMEGRTLEDIAADMGVSKQAVHQRIQVAHSDFHRTVGLHWNDLDGIRIEEL